MTPAERQVWRQLAPYAKQMGTLTWGTALAFGLLCRHVVLLDTLWADPATRGTAPYVALLAKVEGALIRFCVAPWGKPMPGTQGETQPVTPVNPLERYLTRAH